MRFDINKTELQNALAIVLKGVSTRSTLPALSGILIDASEDHLTLIATDLELSVRYRVAALVEEEGQSVVPGKLFNDIVKNLPDSAIQFSSSTESAKIICGKASFSISVLNPEDFPAFPEVEADQSIDVPFNLFSSMVKRVAKVVSRDESRAILTGVLITQEDDKLTMVATDSYRLAITEATLKDQSPTVEPFSVVIAGSFLSDVASLTRSEEMLTLALSENQIVLTYGDATFVNRRIEGKFPNYQQLLPDHVETSVMVDREMLKSAIKRVSLLGTPTTPVRFDINKQSQTLLLQLQTPDVGSAEETLKAEIDGIDMEIAFNYNYILDGLGSIPTDSLTLEVVSPLKPGIFRAQAPENYLYLVMPIRLS